MITPKAIEGIVRNLERIPKLRQEAEEAARAKAAAKDFSSLRDGAERAQRCARPATLPPAEWARPRYFLLRFGLSRYQMAILAENGAVALKRVGRALLYRVADAEAFFRNCAAEGTDEDANTEA